MHSARETGRTKVIPLLAARCGERLVRLGLMDAGDRRRPEAHAIRILLRRAGTRIRVAEILARKPTGG
jgi:hypothetical protein